MACVCPARSSIETGLEMILERLPKRTFLNATVLSSIKSRLQTQDAFFEEHAECPFLDEMPSHER